MMAVRGGMLVSLCFLDSFVRRPFKLISFFGCLGSLEASWSSIRTFAMSAQHRRKRSFSGGRWASFFRLVGVMVTVVVTVVVAMLAAVPAIAGRQVINVLIDVSGPEQAQVRCENTCENACV